MVYIARQLLPLQLGLLGAKSRLKERVLRFIRLKAVSDLQRVASVPNSWLNETGMQCKRLRSSKVEKSETL